MRKTKTITVNDRGAVKTFRITEMSAYHFERWLIRAGLLLCGAGVLGETKIGSITNSQEAQEAIARFLVTDGLKSLGRLNPDDVWPLYDDLLWCCELKVGDYYSRLDADTVDAQIEDVRTLFALRKEVIMLHVDFWLPGSPSGSASPQAGTAGASGRPVISPA